MQRRTNSLCRLVPNHATRAAGDRPVDRAHAAFGATHAVVSGGDPIAPRHQPPARRALTLVEMLIAMAITLVMMAAVVTLFANVSNSVRNRRATIEMSGQLRHVRNMLQQDLQGATCPGLTWQRPESNHGYIELIEGPYREGNASGLLLQPGESPSTPPTESRPLIDYTTSIIPSSNLPLTDPSWITDGGGLGDYDDILMLTVRNEHQPFVSRAPVAANNFRDWTHQTIESPLAEVVWFSVENPGITNNPDVDGEVTTFFGEPGMRTIYRRALLIAPWVSAYEPYVSNSATREFSHPVIGGPFKAVPGLLRILHAQVGPDNVDQALAALVAFQDRYDISARLEFDPRLGSDGRWKIVANTLGDLTKRENRFGHFGLVRQGAGFLRLYPFAGISSGSGYPNNAEVAFVVDREVGGSIAAEATANVDGNGSILSYRIDPDNFADANSRRHQVRPLAYLEENSAVPATAQAMLNDLGQVIRVVKGPVPLWGARRGEDVMMTDVLAFDLRVYDPGAPLFGHADSGTVLEPSDVAWAAAYLHQDNMNGIAGNGFIGNNNQNFPFVGQGAYVDLGYGFDTRSDTPDLPAPRFAGAYSSATVPWFFEPRGIHHVVDGRLLTPGYAMFDTWSFHYEHNGLDEDGDGLIDEGTDGLDSPGHYYNAATNSIDSDVRLGVDDVGERETAPPYDKPLRGVQVLMRVYERDSRQIRQVRVNQHFMPE